MAVSLKARRSKYAAVPTMIDGYRFDSKAEAKRYGELKLLAHAKEIFFLKVHPQYPIDIDGYHVCTVEADFSYFDKESKLHLEDVKGHDTALSKLKRKLVYAVHKHDMEIIKA